MASAFKNIAFTPNVQAVQQQHGSQLRWHEDEVASTDTLGVDEIDFITQQDHFYQATVAENGWPYVQFKGGPPGFVRVLSERRIGYADFKGNRQYLSAGNLRGDERVHLIFIDYVTRQRFKLWGKASIIELDQDPELIQRLEIPTYRARVERGIVIDVLAFDWNCPQHIPQRLTPDEWEQYAAMTGR